MKHTSQKPFKYLMPYLGKYKWSIICALLASFIGGISAVLGTYYTGRAVDSLVGPQQVAFTALYKILLQMLVLYLIVVVTQWLVSFFANRVAYGAIRDLRRDTFAKINQLPLSFYDQYAHGNVISRFTNDLDSVSEAVNITINSLFSGIVIVIASLIYMLKLSPALALVVLATTPCMFIVSWLVTHFSQKNFTAQQRIIGDISGFISEMVGNQKIVSAFGYEQRATATFKEKNQNLYTWGQKAQFTSSLANPSARFIDHIAYLLIGVIGGLLVLSGQITVGIVTSFIIYSTQFTKPFIEITGITTQIQTAIAALNRVFELFHIQPELPDAPNAKVLLNSAGNVAFDEVDFSYTTEQPLIQDLNLAVKSGETVAIVGKTGAGKTTLVNLLMRFYELNRGQILVDGVDIVDYTRDSLRQSFGMVLQDTWLFSGTIKENLAYGKPEATDEEIKIAAKAALAHSFIRRLPKGYDTVIGEKGYALSTGQKQLLTIARAMLTDPPMLILDEATSSVDTLTELRIQKAFLKMMENRTSFVIAHRLSTIKGADVILVMDKGQIVETGNHQSLLEKGGFYARLYNSQFEES